MTSAASSMWPVTERGSDGTWKVDLATAWLNPWGAIVGGYAAAAMLGVCCESSPIPTPNSIAAQFIEPVRPGATEIVVRDVRRGRRIHAMRATLRQDEVVRIEATVCLVNEGEGPAHDTVAIAVERGPDEFESLEVHLHRDGLRALPPWPALEVRPWEWMRPSELVPRAPSDTAWVSYPDAPRPANSVSQAMGHVLAVDLFAPLTLFYPHPDDLVSMTYFPMSLDLVVHFLPTDSNDEWFIARGDCQVARGGVATGAVSIFDPQGVTIGAGSSSLLLRNSPDGLSR